MTATPASRRAASARLMRALEVRTVPLDTFGTSTVYRRTPEHRDTRVPAPRTLTLSTLLPQVGTSMNFRTGTVRHFCSALSQQLSILPHCSGSAHGLLRPTASLEWP